MSDLPKFLSPVQLDRDGWISALDAEGFPQGYGPGTRDAALTERGQRPKGGVWPDGFGVVELEDIPKPEPLPTIHFYRSDRLNRVWPSTDWYTTPERVATITFDEDGNPHRTDVTP